MRNLKQYPITTDEIIKALNDQAESLNAEGQIGDMRPLLFRTAARIIQRAEFTTHDIGMGL